MASAKKLTKELWKDLCEKTKYFLLDCDGVIWHGDVPLPGAPEAIARLKQLGKKVILVTNNSGRSRASFAEKCKALGIDDISADDIVTTSAVLADYIQNVIGYPNSKQVYVIGSQGIANELSLVGISTFGVGPDSMANYGDDVRVLEKTPFPVPTTKIGGVVVGYDPHISFPKAMKAATYLKNPNVFFIATNNDYTYPTSNPDIVCPGTGSVVSFITTASGRTPVVLGKPYPPIFNYIMKKYGLRAEEAVMVGDTLRTDIQFGKLNGMKSLLVLTGHCTPDDLERETTESYLPDFYCGKLGDLTQL